MRNVKLIANISLLNFFILSLSLALVIYSNPYTQGNSDTYTSKSSTEEITINTPENITYTKPMNGYYLATFGFENDQKGEDPMNWQVNEMLGIVNVISAEKNHTKVVELYDNSSIDDVGMTNYFSDQINGTIELWVNVFDELTISINDGNEDNAICLIFRHDGNITIYYSLPRRPYSARVGSYVPNNWYHLKIQFNCSYKYWQLWIDGHEKETFIYGNEYLGSPSAMDSLNIMTKSFWASQAYNYSCYVDAIGYNWDPNYNIGDNKKEGLLLSFENTTSLDWKGFSLDNRANKTILGNTTIPMPVDGAHNIQVFGTSTSLGMIYESDVRHFTIETTPPEISIISPTSGQEFSNPPSFTLSITEVNIASTWYTLNGNYSTPFTGESGVINSTVWNTLSDGPINIRFYVRDIIDNEDFEEVTIIKVPPEIQEISSFNIILLIGIVCIIIGVITKKLKL